MTTPQSEAASSPTSARVLDGTALAARVLTGVRDEVVAARGRTGRSPGLAVVLIGANPASHIYVEAKLQKARSVGIATFEHRFDAITEAELLDLVDRLNGDPKVHGILIQLPLPVGINHRRVLAAVSPEKDADGFHPENQGRLFADMPGVVPCTPRGCLELIRQHVQDLKGCDAVVVGASTIVGRPMAALLLNQGCTVSIGHKLSRDLAALTRKADILVVAAGQPDLIRRDWVKPGAVVVDVGISRVADPVLGSRIVGDVAFAEVAAVADAITPVPGGVGPMTVAMLMRNTLDLFLAAEARARASAPQAAEA